MDEKFLTDDELEILSLICEQIMHGYQIERQINQRNMRAWTHLAISSIYHIMQQLEEQGFIEKMDQPTPHKGIPRKIYPITQNG